MSESNDKDSNNCSNIGHETHGKWIQTTITMYFKPNTTYEHVTTNREFINRRDVNENTVEGILP